VSVRGQGAARGDRRAPPSARAREPWQASDGPYGEKHPTDAPSSGSTASRPTALRTFEVSVDRRTRLATPELPLAWARLSRRVASSGLGSLRDSERGPLYPLSLTRDAIQPGSILERVIGEHGRGDRATSCVVPRELGLRVARTRPHFEGAATPGDGGGGGGGAAPGGGGGGVATPGGGAG
jgi:hypothetical protein